MSQLNASAGHGSDGFDPYYTWLAIPPGEQPPNCYRLLGLNLFESNRDAIEHAADRQMTHLRALSIGKRAALAQQLLNEAAQARITLLDPDKKCVYDATVRDQLNTMPPTLVSRGVPATNSVSSTTPVHLRTEPPSPPNYHAPPTPLILSTRTRGRNTVVETVKIIFGGLFGLFVGYLILTLINRPRDLMIDSKAKPSTRAVDNSVARTKVTIPDPMMLRPRDNHASDRDRLPPYTKQTLLAPTEFNVPQQPQSNPFELPEDNQIETPSQPAAPMLPEVPQQFKPTTTLANLPAAIELPSLETKGWQPIVQLPACVQPEIAIATLGSTQVTIQPSGAQDLWQIMAELNTTSESQSMAVPVAELRSDVTSGELQFQWLVNEPRARVALLSSFLRLKVDENQTIIAMRTAIAAPVLKLTFQKPVDVEPLNIDSLPNTENLVLRIPSITGLAQGARFRRDTNECPVGKDITIEFDKFAGPLVELELVRTTRSTLGIRTRYRFMERSKQMELTLERLEKTKKGASDAAAEAQRKIPEWQNIVKKHKDALQKARTRSVANLNEANRKNIDIAYSAGLVAEAERHLRREQEDLQEAQARLTAVPKLLEFIKSLEESTIVYQILLKKGPLELLLVDGSSSRT